jgi:hypothetical protein
MRSEIWNTSSGITYIFLLELMVKTGGIADTEGVTVIREMTQVDSLARFPTTIVLFSAHSFGKLQKLCGGNP